MALGDKPTQLPRWADAAGRTLEPPEAGTSTEMCKDNGYVQGKTPPARWDNWLANLYYQWFAYLQVFEEKAHTWIESNLFTAGVVVTRADGVGTAITGTGNGSGAGVSGTGGTTGAGVSGTGGSGGSSGVSGTATGSAAGVVGSGGIGSGAGVSGTGGSGGTSAGVSGTGGATNAPGVSGTGGANGAGVVATGGTGSGRGIVAIGTGGSVAIDCNAGNMRFSGSSPANNADPGESNYSCGANQCKVWAFLEIEGGTTTITWDDNYNNATAAITGAGSSITITFARSLANSKYSLNITSEGAFDRIHINSRTDTQVQFLVYRWDPGTQNYIQTIFDGTQADFAANVQIQGRQ